MTSVISSAQKARVIQDDSEAIKVAHELAAEFIKESSERDKQRRILVEEVNKYSQSGLWSITVPKAAHQA